MKTCTVGKISDHLFQMNEQNEAGPYVDAYLVIGEKKAVVIDALQDAENLYEAVRKITDKPLEMLITHAHPDHAGKSMEIFHDHGVPIWIHPDDLPTFAMFSMSYPEDYFSYLKDGMTFDLGGIRLETHLIAGHTKGCVVFLDRKHQLLFSGDSIGSGHFWMQLPHSVPLSEFAKNLAAFYHKVDGLGDLKIYPGHRNQSPVQLNLQYIKDTLALTQLILDGEYTGAAREMYFQGGLLPYCEASLGMMLSYCYDPENL